MASPSPTIIAVPYDSGHHAARMGAGPLHLLEHGLASRLAPRDAPVPVPVELVEPSGAWRAEIATAFDLARGIARRVREASDAVRFPIVLSGNCGASLGATAGLTSEADDLGVVWLDAHGDLNTPASSPTGNAWGMPLRMLIDAGDVDPKDVTLLGARNLDPPETDFIAEAGIRQELGPLPDRIYVALDLDVILPGDLDVFMPEPGGPTFDELEALLQGLPTPIGAGFTGGLRTARNEALLPRLAAAIGL